VLGLGYLYNKLRQFRGFLFRRDPSEFSPVRRALFIFFRFLWMTLEEFWINRGTQKSAALAYTTIIALFPFLAMVSIFATFFYQGGPQETEDMVVQILARYVLPVEPQGPTFGPPDQVEVQPSTQPDRDSLEEDIRASFRRFRDNAGKIAGVGSTGLMIMALMLFSACESFFNQIWRVQTTRSIFKKFSAFSTALVSLPIIITIGTIVSRFFDQQLQMLLHTEAVEPFAVAITKVAAVIVPFLFIWGGLTLAIVLIPNTRVYWRTALIGGLVSSLLWVLAQEFFFAYIRMSPVRRSIIEAFGATLIFLVWLYVLWVVVLLGVEIAYLSQNYDLVLREHFKKQHDMLRDPRLYVLVLGRIGESFYRDEGGIRFDELRQRTNLRESELESVVEELSNRDLVAAREDDRLILQRPPEHLKLDEIFAISCCGELISDAHDTRDRVGKILQDMDAVLPAQFGQMTLRDLLRSDETYA